MLETKTSTKDTQSMMLQRIFIANVWRIFFIFCFQSCSCCCSINHLESGMAAFNDENGKFRFIKSELSGFCLQVEKRIDEDSEASGMLQRPVGLAHIVPNQSNQLWRVNSDHTLENSEGLVLDISGLGGKGSSICANEKSENITQKWHMTHKGELMNDNGMYLTIKGGVKTIQAQLWANTRKNSIAQRWVFIDDVSLDDETIEKLRDRLNVALAVAAVKTAVTHEDISVLFDGFDLDSSGYLEMSEVERLVRDSMEVPVSELSDMHLKAFLKLLDKNGDGCVDFDEFTTFLGFKPRENDDDDDDDDEEEVEEEGDDDNDDDGDEDEDDEGEYEEDEEGEEEEEDGTDEDDYEEEDAK